MKGSYEDMKKYFNIAFIYAITAIASGVFYREFTKFNGFSGRTTLSITHLHFFVVNSIYPQGCTLKI